MGKEVDGIDIPDVPVVTPVVQDVSHGVEHIVDVAHEGRITKVEERQAQHEEALMRQLNDLRASIMQDVEASTGQARQLAESALERVTALSAKVETDVVPEKINEDASGAADFVVPDIETTPDPPRRKGLRERRKRKRT